MNYDKIIFVIILLIIIVAGVMVAYITVNPQPSESFTEFYILGSAGKAADYPTNLTIGQAATVIIGIINQENSAQEYLLIIRLGNQTIHQEKLNLKPGEQKEIPYTFQINQTGREQKLEFLLYKLPDQQNPYRSVFLLIDVQ